MMHKVILFFDKFYLLINSCHPRLVFLASRQIISQWYCNSITLHATLDTNKSCVFISIVCQLYIYFVAG